jgi:SAM-dependent methyltransferase
MAIPISAEEGYNLWADSWDDTPSPIVALEHRMLQPWMRQLEPGRIVDVGCGTGRWAQPLGAIGIDSSLAMLGVAARKPGLQGRVAAADATALPVATGAARVVVCTLTFGHIREQAATMHELARILGPGGTLILTDFHPAAATHGWRRTFRHGDRVYELENHPYTIEWLQSCASAVGLFAHEWVEAMIAEPERELFHRAGRPDLFEAARQIPAVLLSRWTRQ